MARSVTILLVAVACAGCGYRCGYTVRRDIRSVSMPVFANDSFYRNIELGLTHEVTTAIEKKTPYRLVGSRGADAVLEGRIRDYRTTVLQEDARNNPTEIQLALVVHVTLRRPGDGTMLYDGDIREAESYSPSLGNSESHTWAALIRRTAARIVETAFEQDWQD